MRRKWDSTFICHIYDAFRETKMWTNLILFMWLFFLLIYCSSREERREKKNVCVCECMLFSVSNFRLCDLLPLNAKTRTLVATQHIKCDLSKHQRIKWNDISLFASNLKWNTWLEKIKEKKMEFHLYFFFVKKIESFSILFLFTQTTDLWCVIFTQKKML